MGRSGELGYQRVSEAGLDFAGLRESLAQIGAEAAELFDAGDDALLFRKRRNRNEEVSKWSQGYGRLCCPGYAARGL